MGKQFWRTMLIQALLALVLAALTTCMVVGPEHFVTRKNIACVLVSAITLTIALGIERYSRTMPPNVTTPTHDDHNEKPLPRQQSQ